MSVVIKEDGYSKTKKEVFNKFMEEIKYTEEKHALLFEKPEFKKSMKEAKEDAEKLAKLIVDCLPKANAFVKTINDILISENVSNTRAYCFSVTIKKCDEIISIWEHIHKKVNVESTEETIFYWLKKDFGISANVIPTSPVKLSKDNYPEYGDFTVTGSYAFNFEDQKDWRIKHPESILKQREK